MFETIHLPRVLRVLIGRPSPSDPFAEVSRRYRWAFPVATALGLVASLLEGAGISLLIPLLNQMTGLGGGAGAGAAMFAAVETLIRRLDPAQRIIALTVAIFGLILAKAVVQIAAAIFSAWVESNVGHWVRERLFERLVTADYLYLLRQDKAALAKVVSTDTWRLSDAVGLAFSIATQVMTVVLFSILLLLIQWRLCVVVVGGMLAIRAVELVSSRRVRLLSGEASATHAALAERVDKVVEAARIVRLFGQEERERERLTAASERFRRTIFAMHRLTERMVPTLEVLQTGLFILIVLAAGLLAVPLATVGAFLVLLYRLQVPLLNIGRYRLDLAALRGSIDEVAKLLADPAAASSRPRGTIPAPARSDIMLERVSFSYPGKEETPVLDDLTATIPAGAATALVGRSGAGKSTVINLICGLIDPRSGRILIGGVDLRDIDRATWQRQIGVAGQDVDLIDDTIAANIGYALNGATATRIEEVARAVDAHDFITHLPRGYQTTVGSRGLTLSGGQRQKIGLARALLRRPELLILDEATNSLDGISADIVLSLFETSRWFDTAIVISHSEMPIAVCRHVIALDGVMK